MTSETVKRSIYLTLLSSLFPVPLMAQEPDFIHDVVPILKKHCAECHTAGKHKGGFTMNTREELMKENDDGFVLIPGDASNSLLVDLITTDDEDLRMPPKGKGLVDKEVAVISAWINAGAKWDPTFTFEKKTYEPPLAPRRPELPAAKKGREHPIDRILDAHLTKEKSSASSPIDDEGFVRRIHLDIVGLLPTREVTESFVADPSPDKRAKIIASLLANNEAYTGHWLTFWNDLLRNDYAGTGYIDGGRKQISQWLYKSLLENKPYNRFAAELIAPVKGSEGFAHGIKWRGEVSAGQTVPIQYAQSVGQTFLGINLKCASCHDSFTDRWKLTDSYGLAAAFSNEKIEIARCDKPTGKIAEPYWLFPELGKIDASKPVNERLAQVAKLTTMPQNGRFSRTIVNRLWHRLMGRGIVHPVDAMGSEPWNADLLDHLATYLVDNGYDLKKTIAHITSSHAYQSQSQVLASDDESKWKYTGPRSKRMTAEQFVDAIWQITGTTPAKADFAPPSPIQQVRASLMKSNLLMRSLGRPNREQIVTSRPNDLTTLEAMDLNNGGILTQLLEKGAQHLLAKNNNDSKLIANDIFLQALSRKPTAEEAQIIRQTLGEKPDPSTVQDLLWSILVLPEFQLVR